MGSLNEVKQLQKLAGLLKETWHPDKEWDEEDDQEETGEDYPSDEELFGLSEDDYSEDPSSDMDDESQSGDTDAMNINEEDEAITINVPENASYQDFAKAVADQLRDGYGEHNYKPFIQALVAELTH